MNTEFFVFFSSSFSKPLMKQTFKNFNNNKKFSFTNVDDLYFNFGWKFSVIVLSASEN